MTDKKGGIAASILKRIREDVAGAARSTEAPAVVPPPPKQRGPAMNADKVSPEARRALRRLGKGLQIARKARRLTQAQLAKRAGIGRKAVMALEAGTGTPSLAAFAEVMAVVDPEILPVLCDLVESERTTRVLLEMRLPATVRHAKRFVDAPRR